MWLQGALQESGAPLQPSRGSPCGAGAGPLLSLRDPAEGGACWCPACAVRLWEGCAQDGAHSLRLGQPRLSAASRCPLQNYRKSSRHLVPFASKFVRFTHKYISCSPAAAVAFLQKHLNVLQ